MLSSFSFFGLSCLDPVLPVYFAGVKALPPNDIELVYNSIYPQRIITNIQIAEIPSAIHSVKSVKAIQARWM